LKPHFEEGKVPIAALNSNTHIPKSKKGKQWPRRKPWKKKTEEEE
jgi:hypothetical protein